MGPFSFGDRMLIRNEKLKLAEQLQKAKASLDANSRDSLKKNIDITEFLIDQKVKKYLAVNEAKNKIIANIKAEILSKKTGFSASDFFDD